MQHIPGADSAVQLRRVGVELRRHRLAAHKTSVEAAALLGCSHSKISKIESGKISVRTGELRRLLDLYGVPREQAQSLIDINEQPWRDEWWRPFRHAVPTWLQRFLSLEAVAEEIREYAADSVPHLLQTPDYALAALRGWEPERGGAAFREPLALRMARHAVLSRTDPVRLTVVLGEAALRRVVGDRAVMRGQLDRLVDTCDAATVDLHVLPFTAPPCPQPATPFTVLELPGDAGSTVYLEHLLGATYLDQPAEQVGHYNVVFSKLRAAALDLAESRRFIAKVAAEYH